MRVLFIRPNMNDTRASDAMEPLVFAILAGQTPPEVEVALFDERLEAIPWHEPADLVALTVETFTARQSYQIAARFRERGTPVVLGGYHPTLLPVEAGQYADAVVLGDAEGIWPQIIRDAQAGRLQPVYRQLTPPPLPGLKLDHTIFQGKPYAPLALVQYSRGCRFACDFCSIHAFYGPHRYHRPVREVVAEIEALERNLIFLVDDNIFADINRAKELFQALIPLNIQWACQVSIDVTENTELLDLMARSGCFLVLIGFESLDKRNLVQMKKQWNLKHGDYATAMAKLYDRGIMIYATFVFGYDYDTVDSFDITLNFALRSKFALANFNPLMPMPGTGLYRRLLAEDRLIYDRWWLNPGFRYGQSMFHPRGMTADELASGCFYARREFNRYSSILSRALEFRTNCRSPRRLATFLAANLISRKEIFRKQGRRLGSDPVPEVEPGQ